MNQYDFSDAPEPRPVLLKPATGGAVIIAHLLFATIILVALLVNHASAVTAILTSALVYSLTTGSIGELVVIFKHYSLQRYRMDGYMPDPESVHLVNPMQLADREPAYSLPVTSTFVAPVDDSVRREALAFIMQLYDAQGQPDGHKLILTSHKEAPGRLRIPAPSSAAKKYLLSRRVLREVKRGYALNVPRFPARDMALSALEPIPVGT